MQRDNDEQVKKEIVLGKATLKLEIEKNNIFEEHKYTLMHLVSDNYWCFQDNSSKDLWPIIYDCLEKSKCLEIRLIAIIYRFQVCRMICKPLYSNLRKIQLLNCKIVTIQWLEFVNCQTLQGIDLRNNFVSNIKVLGKTLWKNLGKIVLKYNRITQIYLSRIKTSQAMDAIEMHEYMPQMDANIYTKCQFTSLYGFSHNNSKREIIPQQKIMDLIWKKFKKMKNLKRCSIENYKIENP